MDVEKMTDTTKNMTQNLSGRAQEVVGKVSERVQSLTTPKNEPTAHSEGPIARAIEFQTARIPSDVYLWAAFASIGASLVAKVRGRDTLANFIGEWAPTFLILGLYNKLVKVAGSDRLDQHRPIFEGGEASTPALH